MSEENVEIVRGIYGAFDRADFEAALKSIDHEVVWDLTHHSWPGQDQYVGHEGIVEVLAEWMGAFEDYKVEAEQFLDAGDRVVVVQHEVARHKGSDSGIDRRTASIWTLRDGRTLRIDNYLDVPDALEAAGLSD
jgi:ketosteroid isomerase-like protein